ncbi:hypothetical protein F1C76_20375 [Geodermatophilaceae bacterium NBWT11]|nr:hypothetical protein F1C76_20375 [Geodermatophilaceae bacterium NBWT11]
MTAYRLVADHGATAGTFDAADDDTAQQLARVMAGGTATTKLTAYRLQRYDTDGTWSDVSAWMPRRIHSQPVANDTLIRPGD